MLTEIRIFCKMIVWKGIYVHSIQWGQIRKRHSLDQEMKLFQVSWVRWTDDKPIYWSDPWVWHVVFQDPECNGVQTDWYMLFFWEKHYQILAKDYEKQGCIGLFFWFTAHMRWWYTKNKRISWLCKTQTLAFFRKFLGKYNNGVCSTEHTLVYELLALDSPNNRYISWTSYSCIFKSTLVFWTRLFLLGCKYFA